MKEKKPYHYTLEAVAVKGKTEHRTEHVPTSDGRGRAVQIEVFPQRALGDVLWGVTRSSTGTLSECIRDVLGALQPLISKRQVAVLWEITHGERTWVAYGYGLPERVVTVISNLR